MSIKKLRGKLWGMSCHHLGFAQAVLGAADEGVVQIQHQCLPGAAGLLRWQQRPPVFFHHRCQVRQARQEIHVLCSFLCLQVRHLSLRTTPQVSAAYRSMAVLQESLHSAQASGLRWLALSDQKALHIPRLCSCVLTGLQEAHCESKETE